MNLTPSDKEQVSWAGSLSNEALLTVLADRARQGKVSERDALNIAASAKECRETGSVKFPAVPGRGADPV